MSSDLVVELKLKLLLMKPTHDDIIEAKEIYIQLSFERYKGKLMLRNLSPSVYIQETSKIRTLDCSNYKFILIKFWIQRIGPIAYKNMCFGCIK